MPLPAPNTPWPPRQLAVALERIDTWAAWYSGDPEALVKAYEKHTQAGVRPSERPSQYRGGVVGAISRFFWGQPTPRGERRTKLHVPIASDMAATSADLLFSEPMTLIAPDGAVAATQDRLEQLAERSHPTVLEGAEVAAGLGGVFVRAAWDVDHDPDGPWWSTVHADAAWPEWRYGRLIAVTFWRVVAVDGQKVLWHLERHEPGVIEHGLYEGTSINLGRRIDLGGDPATTGLTDTVDTDITLLTASYVPNIRPNRLWRSDPVAVHLGRSDYAGTEQLMDALDEVYSAMMRDVRLGKARAIVPNAFLTSNGLGKGAGFDADQEYFTGVDTLTGTGTNASSLPVTLSQPEIRHEAYLRIQLDLISRVVGTAGYSGQTFGIVAEGEGAATATETAARTRKSLITRDKKGLYWLPELAHMAQVVCQLGNKHFGWGVSDERPKASLPDAVQPTTRELAETAELLSRGGSASIETRVRTVQPAWDEPQVRQEVARIERELGIGAIDNPDTFTGADPAREPVPDDAG